MPGKRYSAGAIFLQVVPVFANVQKAIEAEAKNIDRALGDRMEQSGEKAGQRAGQAASKSMSKELAKSSIGKEIERQVVEGVAGIDRALDGINTRNLGKRLRGEVKAMKADLDSLRDVDLTVDDNVDKVRTKVRGLTDQIEDMRKRSKIFFDIDGLPQVYRKLAQVQIAIDKIDGSIDLDVDTKDAERKIGAFERSIKSSMSKASRSIGDGPNKELRRLRDELEYLGKLRVGIDISASQLHREIGEITAELDVLSTNDVEIDVRIDAGKAWAELSAFQTALDRADGRHIEVNADVDTSRASSSLARLTGSGDDAANSFRSFNGVLLAAAGAGPALIPILGAIAGGLLAIGPAAAVASFGIGSVLIGFSGISDAMSALQNREDEMASTVAQSARSQESSAQRVADARRSAARAIESALDAQKQAQERYADSIQDVKDAEEALREAREAAKGTGGDINRQIQGNELDIDQALIDSFNATVNYNAVMADGSSTTLDKEQARIEREEALLRLKELRAEQRDLAKEKKEWDEEGVRGTDQVKSAQDQLNDAIDAQQDAYEDLGRAAKAVDQARADGARQVAEAMRSQADAMEQISAQQRNVDTAMDKLGPVGRRFALFLFGLKDDFYAFRDDIQAAMLPSVQDAIESFFASKSGSSLRDLMINLAGGFGEFTKALSKSFQGPIWIRFFETLDRIGPRIMRAYGGAFISFLEAMASVMTTLAPYAVRFAEGFAGMADAFDRWASSPKGQEMITDLMSYLEGVAPEVLDLVEALGGAFVNLLIALAPYAEMSLDLLTDLLDFIASMDPSILGPIASAIIVLITASQIAYVVMNLFMAGAALLASTVGVVIFALVGIGLAVAYLYHTNEDFRDFIEEAWAEISEAFMDAWKDSIKPALESLRDAVSELWDQVLGPFFEWLGPVILWLARKVIPMLGKNFSTMVTFVAFMIKRVWIPIVTAMVGHVRWSWKNVLKPTWDAISTAAVWLWEKVLKPVWVDMKDAWSDLMTGMKWVWNNVLKPVFDFISDTALPKLEGAFETTIAAISTVWDGLKKVVGAPIKFVLDTIINKGLIDGFNQVADWVGMDGFDHIPIPKALQSYATGGVMPGYTPGRDVHKFVSPTGGMLELSGGEAVMRPEFTAAVGPDYVNQMNALARSRGVNGVRSALGMGGYWMGGVLPLPGSSVSSHGNAYGHPAYDMNWGAGYDDYGRPIGAWKDGIVAQKSYIGDDSYGRWAVLNHAGNQSSLYAHLSSFADIIVGQLVRAGQTIGYVGDLGNTGNPPTSHLHFEIMGGNVDYADTSTGDGGFQIPSVPDWIKDIVKNPLGAVKGWVTDKWTQASDLVSSSPAFGLVKNVPLELASGVKNKVMDIIPDWARAAAGGIKNALDHAGDVAGSVGGTLGDIGSGIGSHLGLANGGILPYNGTMKYDAGGYLPPGLTTVMNLTGKPEPVFTNDQWKDMGDGEQGGNIHYEPHFEGSDLTASDVTSDMEFSFRKMRRQGGKYKAVR